MRLDSAQKKSFPICLGLKNLDTFWCTGWAWNYQIIFRCASIHGRAGFILWDRHNLFERRSPIILRGRREKGMYFFFQVLFIFFLNYLTGVISLWHMAVPFILPMPLFRRESRRKSFLIRILFQVYFDFA